MDRTLKSLFSLIVILVFVVFLPNCKKVDGTNTEVEYTPRGLHIRYVRTRPLGDYSYDDEYLWIKISLSRPNKDVYLRTNDGTLKQLGPDVFEGVLDEQVVYGTDCSIYVKDASIARWFWPLDPNAGPLCYIATAEGITVETVPALDIRKYSGCSSTTPATIGYFKFQKQQ